MLADVNVMEVQKALYEPGTLRPPNPDNLNPRRPTPSDFDSAKSIYFDFSLFRIRSSRGSARYAIARAPEIANRYR